MAEFAVGNDVASFRYFTTVASTVAEMCSSQERGIGSWALPVAGDDAREGVDCVPVAAECTPWRRSSMLPNPPNI